MSDLLLIRSLIHSILLLFAVDMIPAGTSNLISKLQDNVTKFSAEVIN